MFTLTASGIGVSALSLSYVCSLCGYVAGPLLLLGAATASTISLRMLTKLAILGDINSYAKICENAGGKKLSFLLSLMVIIQMTGFMIGVQVIVTDLIQYSFTQFGIDSVLVHSDNFILIQSSIVAFLVILPMCLVTDISKFRYASLASICSIMYVAVILLIKLIKNVGELNWEAA